MVEGISDLLGQSLYLNVNIFTELAPIQSASSCNVRRKMYDVCPLHRRPESRELESSGRRAYH